jgi:hypothetical protein
MKACPPVLMPWRVSHKRETILPARDRARAPKERRARAAPRRTPCASETTTTRRPMIRLYQDMRCCQTASSHVTQFIKHSLRARPFLRAPRLPGELQVTRAHLDALTFPPATSVVGVVHRFVPRRCSRGPWAPCPAWPARAKLAALEPWMERGRAGRAPGGRALAFSCNRRTFLRHMFAASSLCSLAAHVDTGHGSSSYKAQGGGGGL